MAFADRSRIMVADQSGGPRAAIMAGERPENSWTPGRGLA
jgi:hypothetical protein